MFLKALKSSANPPQTGAAKPFPPGPEVEGGRRVKRLQGQNTSLDEVIEIVRACVYPARDLYDPAVLFEVQAVEDRGTEADANRDARQTFFTVISVSVF